MVHRFDIVVFLNFSSEDSDSDSDSNTNTESGRESKEPESPHGTPSHPDGKHHLRPLTIKQADRIRMIVKRSK